MRGFYFCGFACLSLTRAERGFTFAACWVRPRRARDATRIDSGKTTVLMCFWSGMGHSVVWSSL